MHSPIYVLRTTTLDKAKGIAALNDSIALITEEIGKYDRGEAKVKDGGEARCVTNYDDVEKAVDLAAVPDDEEGDSDDEDNEEGISGPIAGIDA